MIKGLPDKLKLLRKKYGLSQKEVAERIDISTSIVSGYETGERTPSADKLLALAYLYHCSTDYLLGKETDLQKPVLEVDGLSAEQVKALTILISSMKQ